MPRMLEELKRTRHGNPVVNKGDEGNDEALTKAWDEILDRMIFLLREASEETCKRKNPYEAEYHKASEEFESKYGRLGEKLQTEEDKKISQKYRDEDTKLHEYRRQCKNEAIELFSKYFYDLWD